MLPAQENGTVVQDDVEQLRAEIEQLRAEIEIERERASRGFWDTIREDILRRKDAPMLEKIENLRSQLRQEREELTIENARLRAELEERSQSQAARQRGILSRLFGPRQWDPWDEDEMERARERIRGRIALILITALLVVMGLSFWYILRMSRNLDAVTTDDLITVIQMVGTTLLTPLIGLIGAVTGFYYGGQTAVQAASQGAQTATQAATEATQAARATQAATQAAQAAQSRSDSPTRRRADPAREAARNYAQVAAQMGETPSRIPGIVPKR